MVFTLKSLGSFNCIFQLKLDFRIVGTEFYADFVNEFRSQSKVRPPREILMFLVLKLILAPCEKFGHHLPHRVWAAHVSDILNHRFV